MNPSVTAEAPDRLDFLGGVADYSGSLALEIPIRASTRVRISETRSRRVIVSSLGHGKCSADLGPLLAAADPAAVRAYLNSAAAPHWSRYVLGCLWMLSQAKSWRPLRGLRFQITSRTHESQGVSSSAALEVSTLRALGRFARVQWSGTELARLAQAAENQIVGAPCGLMDQLAVEHGRHGSLIPILCRPDQVRKPILLPAGPAIVGWPSGVQHAVSGSPYAIARTATFMGKRIFERKLGRRFDYAAWISPAAFRRNPIPETISGHTFLVRYRNTSDPLSRVDRRRSYRVRSALQFPIEENHRCELAELLLRDRRAGGVYGTRTSGGSGGTVVILLQLRTLPKIRALARSAEFRHTSSSLIHWTPAQGP